MLSNCFFFYLLTFYSTVLILMMIKPMKTKLICIFLIYTQFILYEYKDFLKQQQKSKRFIAKTMMIIIIIMKIRSIDLRV